MKIDRFNNLKPDKCVKENCCFLKFCLTVTFQTRNFVLVLCLHYLFHLSFSWLSWLCIIHTLQQLHLMLSVDTLLAVNLKLDINFQFSVFIFVLVDETFACGGDVIQQQDIKHKINTSYNLAKYQYHFQEFMVISHRYNS